MQSARIWREFPQRYRLEAEKCTECGTVHFPPRPICRSCRSRTFDATRLPERGRVVTFTVIHVGASEFITQVPFVIAIVELDGEDSGLPAKGNGRPIRITMQLVDWDPEDLKIGQPVRLEFRKIQQEGISGIISYGYKCVPA